MEESKTLADEDEAEELETPVRRPLVWLGTLRRRSWRNMNKTNNNGPRESSARKAPATSLPIWACPTPTSGWPGRTGLSRL